MDSWFYDDKIPCLVELGKCYYLSKYLVDTSDVQTQKIQELIDYVAANEGGVIVVDGKYKTGALFFKQGVNLYLEEDSMLIGSDDILDYPLVQTRIEGETCLYYSALINVLDVDGFVIAGSGVIDGNGLKFWRSFWQRLKWNPKCSNKDEQRPRLLFISNSKNVVISGVTLRNSPFWTTHIYKCEKVKYLNCNIYSPFEPVKAPSTDAIDIDACSDVLIKGSNISVNDDAVVLKGGKGPYADLDSNNGGNYNILVIDCNFGFCHSCLTCGSESIHNKNIIMKGCRVDGAKNMLWLKMRPDTPQIYEDILIEDFSGKVLNGVFIKPWTQFFDLKDRKDIPMSYANNIVLKDIDIECDRFFSISKKEDQYKLSNFKLVNINVLARVSQISDDIIENLIMDNVNFK